MKNINKALIGSYFHQDTKFLVVREKNFTLKPCLLEEFGSSQCCPQEPAAAVLPPAVIFPQAGCYARFKEDIKTFHPEVKVSKSVKRFQRYSHFKIRQFCPKFLLLS